MLLFHFLEHVPDQRAVQAYINKALKVSRRFVLIKQPYFDADGYLARKGLKLYWSDWTGHPNRMTSLDLALTLRNSGTNFIYSVHGHSKIKRGDEDLFQAINAPIDQHHHNPGIHPGRKVPFLLPRIYRETIAVAAATAEEHDKALLPFKGDLAPIIPAGAL